MPLYDFECFECHAMFERMQRAPVPEPLCPACGGATRRAYLSAPAIHGAAAVGREQAVRSLPQCGKGCRCCP